MSMVARSIKLNTAAARLILEAALSAWEEAPMLNRCFYETVDNTFRDIMGAIDPTLKLLPFGGKTAVLEETYVKSCQS